MGTDFRQRLEAAFQEGQERGDLKRKSPDAQLPTTWPPGSIMAIWSGNFFGLGLVVANDGHNVRVLWDAHCGEPFKEYECHKLNRDAIFRVL